MVKPVHIVNMLGKIVGSWATSGEGWRGLKYKTVNYVHMSKNLISENQARYILSGWKHAQFKCNLQIIQILKLWEEFRRTTSLSDVTKLKDN